MRGGKTDALHIVLPGSLARVTSSPHGRLPAESLTVGHLIISRRPRVKQQLQTLQVAAAESLAYSLFEDRYPQLLR
jgi:hypothetical protein